MRASLEPKPAPVFGVDPPSGGVVRRPRPPSSPFTDAYEGPGAPPPPPEPPPKRSLSLGALFGTKLVTGVYHWLTDHDLWAEQNLGLLDHLGPDAPRDPKILDLGAGTGIGSRALARALEGRGEVIGLDFSTPMVKLANEKAKQEGLPNVRFVQGDATNLTGFATDSVDYVVANSFLYLVPDAQAALREARRVLKPGGRLVFMEPREEGSLVQATRHATKNVALDRPYSALRLGAAMLAWRAMSGLEGRRTEAQLTDLFARAGFSSVRFEPTLGGLGHHVIAQ